MTASPPTLKDIARNLGLSVGTVQRALHNKGGYRAATREAVLREAERIGYSTNMAASSLRRAPISLGVCLPDPTGDNRFFYPYLWKGIDAACRDLSMYQIDRKEIRASGGEEEIIGQMERLFLEEEPVQGVITYDRDSPRFETFLLRCEEKDIPVFIVNAAVPPAHAMTHAFNTTRVAADLAADLFSAVHSTFVGSLLVLGGARENRMHAARTAHFIRRMETDCPGLTLYEVHGYGDLDKLRRTVGETLGRVDDLVGIYAATARETLTMCEAVKEKGLSGKITLVGTGTFPELLPYLEDGTLIASIYQAPAKISYLAVLNVAAAILKTARPPMSGMLPVFPVLKSIAPVLCDPEPLI